jgi:4-amino-4-deoxy-L-arabinose transferase-like glycosyltransferase
LSDESISEFQRRITHACEQVSRDHEGRIADASKYVGRIREGQVAMRASTLIAIVMVVALAGATTLHRLGAADVCGSNEAVEAVFLQQMVEHDALLFPLENGRSPMYKPPLFHWTAVAIDRLAGINKVTAFNLRLPAALYAIAGVMLTIAFASAFMGANAGILAGLILVASYQYIENARIGRVDMTLCFFETLALFAFAWWSAPRQPAESISPGETPPPPDVVRRGANYLRYVLAISLGLAVLAKGPVGALLPGLAMVVFIAVEKRWRDVLRLATPGPVIVTIAIGSSWYLACLLGRRYGFLDRQIGSENFGRFFGSLGAMKPWYYLKPVLLNSAPLSLLVPFAVFAALRTYWHPIDVARAPNLGEVQPPAGESSAVSQGGRRPSQNPISLFMSLRMMFNPSMDAVADASSSPADTYRSTLAVRLFAIFWVATVIFFTVAAYKRRAYLLPLWPASAVMLSWWVTSLTRSRNGKFVRPAVIATCAVLIAINFFYLPHREVRECAGDSMREAAAQINRVVGPSEPLYLFQFEDEPAPLLFYLNRTAPRIWGKLGEAPPGYVLATAEAWNRHKGEALDLEPVLTTSSGHPQLVLLRRGKALATR